MPNRRKLQAEDLTRIQVLDDFSCQPGGPWTVYAVRKPVPDSPRYISHLYRVRKGSEPDQLTSRDCRDLHPRISPDGRWVAFLSDRQPLIKRGRRPKVRQQLYILPMHGGEATAMTELDGDFAAPVWHPDSASLIVPFQVHDALLEGRTQPAMLRYKKLPFRSDGHGFLPQAQQQLLRIWRDGRAHQVLTESDSDCQHPAISPDGKWLAYTTNPRAYADFEAADLFVMPMAGGASRRLGNGTGWAGPPAWTPDGKKILYAGHAAGPGQVLKTNTHVFEMDVASAIATDLMPELDRCVGALVLADVQGLSWSPPPPVQRPDGGLIFPIADRGRNALLRRDPQTGNLAEIPVPGSVCALGQLGDGTLVVLTTEHTRPGELFALAPGEKPRQMTHLHDWLADEIDLQSPQMLWYDAPDGTPIQGFLLTPDGVGPHPTLVQIHGGPMVQFGANFVHELHWLRACGYAVFYCNPRGSQGYGEAFARSIYQDWYTGPMSDVLAGVDLLVEKKVIDPKRLGVTGGSYGGYLTNMLIAHDPRFSAAVTQRCVADMAELFWDADFGPNFAHEMGGWPDEEAAVYKRNSPMTYVRDIRTPTLVLHSLSDQRTTPQHAFRLFQALQMLGVPSEMVLFPDSYHDLSRTGPMDQRLLRLQAIREWFDRWLLQITAKS